MRYKIIASSIALLSVCSQAYAISEQENNNKSSSAHILPLINGSTAVEASISDKNDIDFYSFYGKSGDVINIDIDGGIGGAESVDTILTVFSPAPELQILRMMDDAPDIDSGSTSTQDARIDKLTLPTTGNYYVAVTRYRTFFASTSGSEPKPENYDNVFMMFNAKPVSNKGDYTLTVSHDAPPIQQISINIKPGNNDASPINPKSKGKIPVAILSSPLFEALNVDVNTLTFGSTGNEKSLSKCNWNGDDVNGDGRVDRICHFENQLAGFKQDDLEGILRGKTLDGKPFEGRAYLKVVPKSK